jgi:hypothetical protein
MSAPQAATTRAKPALKIGASFIPTPNARPAPAESVGLLGYQNLGVNRNQSPNSWGQLLEIAGQTILIM